MLPSRYQQSQRTLLDRLRAEYGNTKHSNKLPAAIDLDPDAWLGVGCQTWFPER
jgi:hypothetical protein